LETTVASPATKKPSRSMSHGIVVNFEPSFCDQPSLCDQRTAAGRYRRAQLHNFRHPKLICEFHGERSAIFIDGVQESISPARSFLPAPVTGARHWRRVKYRSRARRGLSCRTTGTPAFRVRFAILTSSMKTWISGGRSGSHGSRKRKPRSRSRRGVFDRN
jgi:hypothetical protein